MCEIEKKIDNNNDDESATNHTVPNGFDAALNSAIFLQSSQQNADTPTLTHIYTQYTNTQTPQILTISFHQ